MKKLKQTTLALALSVLVMSCGDAGVGFDVTADYPVEAPVDISLPSSPIDVNPDFTTINYNLNDVDAFQDALDDLQNQGGISPEDIEIIALSYEINGVDNSENVPLDEVAIDLNSSSGTFNIPIITGQLSNQPKTEITLTSVAKDAIISDLQRRSQIDADLIVDLGTISAGSTSQIVDFEFKLYFNVLLRVRDLN